MRTFLVYVRRRKVVNTVVFTKNGCNIVISVMMRAVPPRVRGQSFEKPNLVLDVSVFERWVLRG